MCVCVCALSSLIMETEKRGRAREGSTKDLRTNFARSGGAVAVELTIIAFFFEELNVMVLAVKLSLVSDEVG